jgi:8-oxo-dGTP diphosphatase
MSAQAPARRVVEVVAAVIERRNGAFLLAQRPPGKVYSGYWEFPGGKVEPDEAPLAALTRELHEELGIDVEQAYPWIVREYAYEHAHVRLNFFRVVRWRNEPISKEAQALAWQRLPGIGVGPMLPANGPVLRALRLPRLLGISDAAQRGEPRFLKELDIALCNGLRMVMVREKQMGHAELAAFASRIAEHCAPHDTLVIVNGDLDAARTKGVAGLHLPAAQLMRLEHRPAIDWCSASCHNEAELRQAAALNLDFVVLGPVCPTPSHPDTPALGWANFARLITRYPLPVYALGGLRVEDLDCAYAAGAHGLAMIRGAWDASYSVPSEGSRSD